MTRSDLIAELAASRPHLRVADVELIVATIFDQITGALARGDRVELRGFGAFSVKQRSARIGHNPRTGVTVQVSEKTVPYLQDRQGTARPARRRVSCWRGFRCGASSRRDCAYHRRLDSRACRLSVTPGNRRRSSIAADSSPRCS